MSSAAIGYLERKRHELALTARVKQELRRNRPGLPKRVADPWDVDRASVKWLGRAHDMSRTQDGAVKDSIPVDGDYGSFEYFNWAAKFLIDSLQCERGFRKRAL
jgi:hypothetical protein